MPLYNSDVSRCRPEVHTKVTEDHTKVTEVHIKVTEVHTKVTEVPTKVTERSLYHSHVLVEFFLLCIL